MKRENPSPLQIDMLFLLSFFAAGGTAINDPIMVEVAQRVHMQELTPDLNHCLPLAALSASGS